MSLSYVSGSTLQLAICSAQLVQNVIFDCGRGGAAEFYSRIYDMLDRMRVRV